MDWKALQAASSDAPDADVPDAAAWRAMRAPMERAIATAQHSPRPRTSRVAARGISRTGVAGLALAASSALVLSIVLVAAPTGSSSAEAAVVLQRAADHAVTAGTPAGATVLSIRSKGVDGAITKSTSNVADVALHVTSRTLLRVPRAAEGWVRKRFTISRSYAYGDHTAAVKWLAEPHATAQHPEIERSQSGVFVNNPTARRVAAFGDYPADYRNLPRDPQALLGALRGVAQGWDDPSNNGVLQAADSVLTSGMADPALQSAIYQALQRLPGIAIVDHDATDLEGRHGVGIGVADSSSTSTRQVLIVDPASGRYLGERVYAVGAQGVIPDGTELTVTAVDSGLAADCCGPWTPAKGDVAFQYP